MSYLPLRGACVQSQRYGPCSARLSDMIGPVFFFQHGNLQLKLEQKGTPDRRHRYILTFFPCG